MQGHGSTGETGALPWRGGPSSRRYTLARGALVCAAMASSRPVRAAGAIVRIGGTGSALAVIRAVAESYRSVDPAVEIQVLPSLGSNGGLRALQAGAIDLALATRALNEAERAAGLRGRAMALTPVVFATHPATGIGNISLVDVARIYAGEIQAWPDGTPVRLIRRPPTEADWATLANLSPAMARAIEDARLRPGLVTAASDQDNAEALEAVRGSFGLAALGQLLAERRRLTPLALDGVAPSVTALAERRWPLAKALHIAMPDRMPATVAGFARFALGTEGAAILASCGHLPAVDAGT